MVIKAYKNYLEGVLKYLGWAKQPIDDDSAMIFNPSDGSPFYLVRWEKNSTDLEVEADEELVQVLSAAAKYCQKELVKSEGKGGRKIEHIAWSLKCIEGLLRGQS